MVKSYLGAFVERWDGEFSIDLIHELRDALRDTPRKARYGEAFAKLYAVLNFCVEFDRLSPWVGKKRPVLEAVALFSAEQGCQGAHRVLTEVLASAPAKRATKFDVMEIAEGFRQIQERGSTPADKAAAQIALINARFAKDPGLALEDALHGVLPELERAVVLAITAHAAEWDIAPPLRQRRAEVAKSAIPLDALASLAKILGRKRQSIWGNPTASSKPRVGKNSVEFAVSHAAGKPAAAAALAGLTGKATKQLRQIYASHDGANLFVVDGQPALVLAPACQWAELHYELENHLSLHYGSVHRIPAGIRSAIAFAYIPGDAERWLLITKGKYAGSVRLSDMDSLDGPPTIQSLDHFFATLASKPLSIINNGGFVRYEQDGKVYFPARYEFEAQ